MALWWLALAALAMLVQHRLVVSGDLRDFMPPPTNADQKLLLDEIGEGPASRLLLIAIGGTPPEHLADLSRGVAQTLRADAQFERVLNGDSDITHLQPALLPCRYLLTPTLDDHVLDAAYLREELQQRVEDLGSPVGEMVKDLLPR